MSHSMRIEHDLLGERKVPAPAYYGIHTLRATENFPISGTPISTYADLVTALASVKKAAALANHDLGFARAACWGSVRGGELSQPHLAEARHRFVGVLRRRCPWARAAPPLSTRSCRWRRCGSG